MKEWNKIKLTVLYYVCLSLMLFNTVFSHSSLMLDLERQYEDRALWAESLDPKLSLVIMMESQSFEEEKVLKDAIKFLKTFNSSYDRVSLIFSDKQSVGFLPAQRYGVVLLDGKVQTLVSKELRDDAKLVMAVSRARASAYSDTQDSK